MKTIEVNGRSVRIKPFGTRYGLGILTRLTTIAGPAFVTATGEGSVIDALLSLCDRLKPEDVDWLIDEFTKQSEVKLTEPEGWVSLVAVSVFDTVFETNYTAVLAWLRAGLELNYLNFFGSIGLEKIPVLEKEK